MKMNLWYQKMKDNVTNCIKNERKSVRIKEYWKQKIMQICFHILELVSESKTMDQSTVQSGDVIWCLMPLDKQQLLKIAPGHRVRPFVIVSVAQGHALGFACSSSKNKRVINARQYVIQSESYGIKKSSYVDTSHIWKLPYDHMQQYFYRLKEDDFQAMLKCQYADISHEINQTEYSVGSIVKYKESLYYIYDFSENHFDAHPLQQEKTNRKHLLQAFSCQGKVYYLNYSVTVMLYEDQKMEICMQASKKDIKALQRKKEAAMIQSKQRK